MIQNLDFKVDLQVANFRSSRQLRPGTEEEFEAARQAEAGLDELQRKLIRECPVCTYLMVAPIRIYRCK